MNYIIASTPVILRPVFFLSKPSGGGTHNIEFSSLENPNVKSINHCLEKNEKI